MLEARITRLKARQSLEQTKHDHLRADLRLNSLLGSPPNVELELTSPAGDRPPKWLVPDNDDWRNEALAAFDLLVAEALRQRPELARLKSARDVVGKEERLARARRAPDLTLSLGPDYVPGGRPTFGAFVMASLQVPVFDRQQGALAEARARRAQLAGEGDALAHEIARQVADAVTAACFQQSQLRLYEREQQLRRSVRGGRAGPLRTPARAPGRRPRSDARADQAVAHGFAPLDPDGAAPPLELPLPTQS